MSEAIREENVGVRNEKVLALPELAVKDLWRGVFSVELLPQKFENGVNHLGDWRFKPKHAEEIRDEKISHRGVFGSPNLFSQLGYWSLCIRLFIGWNRIGSNLFPPRYPFRPRWSNPI
jgi:hypothetical protein